MFDLMILAQAAPAAPQSGGGSMLGTLIFAAAVFGILYFLILRPQKKKDQQRRDMLSKVEPGQNVVTIGGIYGEVKTVKDEYCILLVDPERGGTLKMRRSAVHEILAPDSGEDGKQHAGPK